MNFQPALNNAPQKYLIELLCRVYENLGIREFLYREVLRGTSFNHERVSKMEKHLQDRDDRNVTGV